MLEGSDGPSVCYENKPRQTYVPGQITVVSEFDNLVTACAFIVTDALTKVMAHSDTKGRVQVYLLEEAARNTYR